MEKIFYCAKLGDLYVDPISKVLVVEVLADKDFNESMRMFTELLYIPFEISNPGQVDVPSIVETVLSRELSASLVIIKPELFEETISQLEKEVAELGVVHICVKDATKGKTKVYYLEIPVKLEGNTITEIDLAKVGLYSLLEEESESDPLSRGALENMMNQFKS